MVLLAVLGALAGAPVETPARTAAPGDGGPDITAPPEEPSPIGPEVAKVLKEVERLRVAAADRQEQAAQARAQSLRNEAYLLYKETLLLIEEREATIRGGGRKAASEEEKRTLVALLKENGAWKKDVTDLVNLLKMFQQ